MEKFYKKILCPIDFSTYSEVALMKAASLARLFKAELVLIHIINHPWSDSYSNKVKKYLTASEVEDLAAGMLTELSEKYATDLDTYTHVTMSEHTYHGIIHYAEEQNVELIVMSTHGRTGTKRLLMGSVAENVVRRAPCSVFVVRD